MNRWFTLYAPYVAIPHMSIISREMAEAMHMSDRKGAVAQSQLVWQLKGKRVSHLPIFLFWEDVELKQRGLSRCSASRVRWEKKQIILLHKVSANTHNMQLLSQRQTDWIFAGCEWKICEKPTRPMGIFPSRVLINRRAASAGALENQRVFTQTQRLEHSRQHRAHPVSKICGCLAVRVHQHPLWGTVTGSGL